MALTYTMYLTWPVRDLKGDTIYPIGTVVTDEVIKQSIAYGTSSFLMSVHKPV